MNTSTAQQGEFSFSMWAVDTTTQQTKMLLKLVYNSDSDSGI
jgi:hypothetical protein